MNPIIVDSSVAIKWYVTEEHSEEARRLLTDYQSGALDFLAPDLIYAEVGSIVWKKQTLRGLPMSDAEAVLAAFHALPMTITPSADLFQDAYQIAIVTGRTVYDCLYLALSVRENCRFVTADEKLANAVSSAYSQTIWLPLWT